MPLTELLTKVKAIKMSNDAGHCHRAIAPRRAKGKFKFVILYILIAVDMSLRCFSLDHSIIQAASKTYNSYMSPPKMVSNRFGDCWFLCDA